MTVTLLQLVVSLLATTTLVVDRTAIPQLPMTDALPIVVDISGFRRPIDLDL